VYEVKDLTWVVDQPDAAVAVFRFEWSGEVDGAPASGRGGGASVLKRIDGQWRTVHEHLSPGRWRSRPASPSPPRA